MARHKRGTAYRKYGGWYIEITLDKAREIREGRPPRARYKCPVPPRPDGLPLDDQYCRALAEQLNREYILGLFAPPSDAPPPASESVLEYCRRKTVGAELRQVELYVAPSPFAALRLSEVRQRHAIEFLRWLEGRPSRNGGNLAPRTRRNVRMLLRRLFRDAKIEELVALNPFVELPPGLTPDEDKDPEARANWIYDREDVELLISDERIPRPRRVLYAIDFLTGDRYGEGAAYRWRDWDPTRKPLGGLKTARSISAETGSEKSTKTKVAKWIPVHPTLAAILAEWKLSGWAEEYGRAPTPDDFIVPTRDEETGALVPRRSWNAAKQIQADCRALGLRDNRRAHDTRAAFISLAIEDGADAAILKLLTHKKKKEAFDVYPRLPWHVLCREIEKLEIRRREPGKVVPLERPAE